jgi:uncharacterized protein
MDKAPTPVIDWMKIVADLDQEGYALLPNLLDNAQAKALATSVAPSTHGRQVPPPDDVRHGQVWDVISPLPEPLERWHHTFYEKLIPAANRWSQLLDRERRFPEQSLEPLLRVSQLREDDYLALHHSALAANAFPLQMVVLLSEPGNDFTGGELVMTEQRPRMQSRPMVLPLGQGDAAIITLAHRPAKGSRGHYQVTMKHAISRVRSGERLGIDLLFTDAQRRS